MRYTGPKMKLCRREGRNLFGSEKYAIANSNRGLLGKPYSRLSLYGKQLRSKQAARRTYGVSEKQFVNYYKKAVRMSGSTIYNMNMLLETRLDVAVLRSNFARTIMQARQFVNHGHFLVNGKKVNIPSYTIKPGDVIEVSEKHKDSALYKSLLEEFAEFEKTNKNGSISTTSWITVDAKNLKITVDRLPENEDFDKAIDMTKIIEYYSK